MHCLRIKTPEVIEKYCTSSAFSWTCSWYATIKCAVTRTKATSKVLIMPWKTISSCLSTKNYWMQSTDILARLKCHIHDIQNEGGWITVFLVTTAEQVKFSCSWTEPSKNFGGRRQAETSICYIHFQLSRHEVWGTERNVGFICWCRVICIDDAGCMIHQ